MESGLWESRLPVNPIRYQRVGHWFLNFKHLQIGVWQVDGSTACEKCNYPICRNGEGDCPGHEDICKYLSRDRIVQVWPPDAKPL